MGKIRSRRGYWQLFTVLVFLGIFLLAGCKNSGQVAADQWQRPLETAFAVSGADFAKWYLAGWGTLAQEAVTEEDLAAIGKEVCKELAIEVTGNTSQRAGDSFSLLYTGTKGVHQYEILLQRLPLETYLIININSVAGEGEMSKEENLLREVLTQFTMEPEPDISAMIKGYLPEQYTERKGKKILTKMIEEIGGMVVERTIEKGYMSFTGYAEALEKSVLVGTQKVNLQCSLSYDETKGKTLVYLATPLIFAEY